jgi:MarR family transcriptional regulator, temperature-dependent positive regulator of motility
MLPIYQMPGHLIRRLHQMSAAVFLEKIVTAGEDITPVQYGALSAVRAYPGLDQATIASMIAYDRVTIGGVLDRLEQKSLLTRKVNSTDKRAKVVYLTTKGQKLLQMLDPIVAKLQDGVLPGLNAEEKIQLMELIAKVITAGGGDLSDQNAQEDRKKRKSS